MERLEKINLAEPALRGHCERDGLDDDVESDPGGSVRILMGAENPDSAVFGKLSIPAGESMPGLDLLRH
jgi:hypothetical protein